jgi:ABC-type polysaccharide/polyol phosphate export permease
MKSYFHAMWRCRYFWLSLVKMDLRTRYRRSLLGMGWSLLHPIAMTIILCIVFSRIFKPEGGVRQYAPMLLAGLACWDFIRNTALHGCQCFYIAEPYIRQYPAPMAIYPLRTSLGGTIHLLIALAVVIGLSWLNNPFANLATLLSLVPAVVLLFLLGWSLAVLAGIANVYFQDTEHLCEVGFQILFYATPIIYPTHTLRANHLGWVADYNPLVSFLNLVREPIIGPDGNGIAQIPSLATFSMATMTVLVLFSISAFILTRVQRRLIFHL